VFYEKRLHFKDTRQIATRECRQIRKLTHAITGINHKAQCRLSDFHWHKSCVVDVHAYLGEIRTVSLSYGKIENSGLKCVMTVTVNVKTLLLLLLLLLLAQLVEALRYKPEGRGFDSRWCHWNFSLT
jgi:hypothetical protein